MAFHLTLTYSEIRGTFYCSVVKVNRSRHKGYAGLIKRVIAFMPEGVWESNAQYESNIPLRVVACEFNSVDSLGHYSVTVTGMTLDEQEELMEFIYEAIAH